MFNYSVHTVGMEHIFTVRTLTDSCRLPSNATPGILRIVYHSDKTSNCVPGYIPHRVDPNSKSRIRRTPLSYAVEEGREAVMELLLAQDGVNPDF